MEIGVPLEDSGGAPWVFGPGVTGHHIHETLMGQPPSEPPMSLFEAQIFTFPDEQVPTSVAVAIPQWAFEAMRLSRFICVTCYLHLLVAIVWVVSRRNLPFLAFLVVPVIGHKGARDKKTNLLYIYVAGCVGDLCYSLYLLVLTQRGLLSIVVIRLMLASVEYWGMRMSYSLYAILRGLSSRQVNYLRSFQSFTERAMAIAGNRGSQEWSS